MRAQHIAMLGQITGWRMPGDERNDFCKMLAPVTGTNDAIKSNPNRLVGIRRHFCKRTLQSPILFILRLIAVENSSRICRLRQPVQHVEQIDPASWQVMKAAQPVGDDPPLTGIQRIAQCPRGKQYFKLGQFAQTRLPIHHTIGFRWNGDRIFFRIKPILVSAGKKAYQRLRLVKRLIIGNPDEVALVGVIADNRVSYGLFSINLRLLEIVFSFIEAFLPCPDCRLIDTNG